MRHSTLTTFALALLALPLLALAGTCDFGPDTCVNGPSFPLLATLPFP
jgi:hypothetical protein